MKKLITLALSLLLLLSMGAQSVYAAGTSQGAEYTQDADGYSQQFGDYMKQYLFGIDEKTRTLFQEEVKLGYEIGTIQMMTLMSSYANLRKAAQVAEASENKLAGVTPTVDVIKQYYVLTEEQKNEFASFFTAAFAAINLKAEIKDGVASVTKNGESFATIKLVTNKPVSTARIYMNAYIPGLTDEEKDTLEVLVNEYTANGGSPAGSGAVWRCIREIGQLMGVEATNSVDMQAGTVVVTVTKEGMADLKDASKELRAQVIAKAIEAVEAVGYTYTFENDLFTILKNGEPRFVHTMSYKTTVVETTKTENVVEDIVKEDTTKEDTTKEDTVKETVAGDTVKAVSGTEETKVVSSVQPTETAVSIPKTGENYAPIYISLTAMLIASSLLVIRKKVSAK